MPFEKIQPEKLSLAVVRQIEVLILRGILRPGERLPPERDLAERLGVSRPSLRDALAELGARGLVVTRASDGVYVTEGLGAAFPPPLVELFSAHDEAMSDYVVFRRDVEALAAERAARYASDIDLQVIDAIFRKMEVAHQKRNPADEAKLDADFHMAIIEASHNVILLHMMRALFQMLREGVFYNRQLMFRHRLTRNHLLEQHRAINHALQARDPEAARLAVARHIEFVERTIADQERAERNTQIAKMRLLHEGER